MSKKGWIILISVLVVLIGGATWGVIYLKDRVGEAVMPNDFWGSPTAVVSRGDIESGIFTSGNVRPAQAIDFTYDPSREITFHVENGAEAKKGDILFVRHDPETEFQNEEALANRDLIQAELEHLKKSAASPELEMQIRQLESDLKNAQNRISQLAGMLENNKVKAPFDGVVTLSRDLPVQEENVENIHFVRLSNPGELIISVPIDETDFPCIDVGDKVDITLVAYENESFYGEITYLGGEAYNQNGRISFPAIVTLEPDERIRPGMTADVRVIFAERTDVLLVPVEAVFDDENGEKYVNLITEEGIEAKSVGTGISDGINIEITEGLEEGDKLQMEADSHFFG